MTGMKGPQGRAGRWWGQASRAFPAAIRTPAFWECDGKLLAVLSHLEEYCDFLPFALSLTPGLSGCMTPAKIFSPTEPQFYHLQNGENDSTYLNRLSQGINDLIHIVPCPA